MGLLSIFRARPAPPPDTFTVRVVQHDETVLALRVSGLLQRRLTHLEYALLVGAGVLTRWPSIVSQGRNLTYDERLELMDFADEVLSHG